MAERPMPAGQSREGPSIRWTEEDHARLLRMISASELYRCTFFPSGMVRPTVWRAARDLFLEFFRDQPQILNEWKRKGYVSIDADGQWKATAAWASKTSNPIINKLHILKGKYRAAQARFRNLQQRWTRFKEVPAATRAALREACPQYFLLHQLFNQPGPDELPAPRSASPSAPRTQTIKDRKAPRARQPATSVPRSPPLSVAPVAGPSNARATHGQSVGEAVSATPMFASRPTAIPPSTERRPGRTVMASSGLESEQAPSITSLAEMLSGSHSSDTASSGSPSEKLGSEHDMETDWGDDVKPGFARDQERLPGSHRPLGVKVEMPLRSGAKRKRSESSSSTTPPPRSRRALDWSVPQDPSRQNATISSRLANSISDRRQMSPAEANATMPRKYEERTLCPAQLGDPKAHGDSTELCVTNAVAVSHAGGHPEGHQEVARSGHTPQLTEVHEWRRLRKGLCMAAQVVKGHVKGKPPCIVKASSSLLALLNATVGGPARRKLVNTAQLDLLHETIRGYLVTNPMPQFLCDTAVCIPKPHNNSERLLTLRSFVLKAGASLCDTMPAFSQTDRKFHILIQTNSEVHGSCKKRDPNGFNYRVISLDGKAISPGDSAKTHPGPKLSKAKGQRKAAEGGKGQSRKEKKKKKRAGQQGEGKQSKSKTKKNAKKDKA